ncbi:MAG: ATP-dependent helicase, partial [Verrucomicrobiae bacterium]|nr:ATP-dependent helicase [Verrucomicrobiae bacterium]
MSLIDKLREGRLSAYRSAPGDIREHFGIEETVLAGGYGYRQVMELIQNGADAILEDQEAIGQSHQQARITVALVDDILYVANTGSPLNEEGVKALLQSHSSPKRGNQIGRFGIGFKSLLRLDGRIDLISQGLSMRFDPDEARRLIRREFALDESVPVPALRVAWDLDGDAERLADPVLGRYDWATTIVRAQVRNEMMLGHLREEMEKFPGGFLLFLPVSLMLTMDFGDGTVRRLERRPEGQELVLVDGEESSRWLVVERMVTVTDTGAKNDATHLHARDQVPLTWALPLETKREEAGRFWAFFPTETPSRLPGILNAPWKLNSDRRSLIDGEWNRFLMMEAGKLVAEILPTLATEGDPGKPIDVFPRRVERKDEVAAVLVESLWERLVDLPVIPDCKGALRFGQELKLHPVGKKDLAESWVELSSGELLTQWIHPSCLEGDRRARVDELAQRIGKRVQGADEGCRPSLQTSDLGSWFAAVATTETKTALKVLALAERYAGEVN